MNDRILVTGSRDWEDWEKMARALGPWFSFDNILVSGHCRKGADLMAEQLWAGWLGIPPYLAIEAGYIEIHPADWKKHGGGAGFKRNGEMVELGARKCLAFACRCKEKKCQGKPPHYTHGTMDCKEKADKAGISVIWTAEDE